MRALFLLPLSAALLLACPAPRPPGPPPDEDADAGDYPVPPENLVEELPEGSPQGLSSPCGKACENLRRVPCREGFPTREGVTCYRGCLSMARHQRVPASCWAAASSPAEARACGGLRCPAPSPDAAR